jgi:cytidine deaminase
MPAPDVMARFTVGGQTFCDVNPLARSLRVSGPTIEGVRPANSDQSTMHAEFGAMFQAYSAGIRGGHGVLAIDGMPCCPWCRGDIKTLARALQLETLTVRDADGSIMKFETPRDFLPIRQGGKAWT